MPAHFENDNRNGQGKPDPEAPGHVSEFRIGAALGGHHQGLKRHAADRAGSRALLADFGMHRTGIDGARRHRFGGLGTCLKIFCRIGHELCLAARRAEIIVVALVSGLVLGRGGINRHAANRIDGAMLVMLHDHPLKICLNPSGVSIRLTDIPP